MNKLIIKEDSKGRMEVELQGTGEQISKALVTAMAQHLELSFIILAAIPSYIDVTGRSRKTFCQTIMDATGANEKDRELFKQHIEKHGGKIV